MYTIFIVEDDPVIAGALQKHLEGWGYRAVCARDFSNVTAEFAAASPQLVLLDIGLPFYNGYHWCGEIRKVSKAPIVFLSSAADNMNIVLAMNQGADDFIAKPFDLNVLTAKVAALLRRSYDFAGATALLQHRGAILDTASGRQQVLACGFGSACFAILFGGVWQDGLTALAVGLCLQAVLLAIGRWGANKLFAKFLGAAFVSLASMVLLRMGLACNLDKAIIGALMPLVPGMALTMGIRDLLDADFLSGVIRMLDALLTAACIACGAGLVLLAAASLPGGIV